MSNNQPTTNQNQTKISNFLETLKQRQQVSPDFSNDLLRSSSFAEIKKQKELEGKRIEQFHQARNREWSQVYSQKEKQVQKRITEVRDQLQRLAKQVTKLETNVSQTLQTEMPQPGEYHLSFLDHLKTLLELLQKDVRQTNSWLSIYQARSKKKGHYWGMAKSQGTSFTLNSERQLATSIG